MRAGGSMRGPQRLEKGHEDMDLFLPVKVLGCTDCDKSVRVCEG